MFISLISKLNTKKTVYLKFANSKKKTIKMRKKTFQPDG